MLEYIILGFLMYGDMSGYDLKQCMSKSTSYFFDASFGSIYPAFKRLEAKGEISSREVVDCGKYKKLYSITDAGKSVFREWLEQPIEFAKTKLDHLVKVFFLGFLPKEKAIETLQAFIKEVEPVLHELIESQPKIKLKTDIYQYSTLLYGINYYRFIIDWSHDLLKELTKR
ncbi:MAG TPA: PadR family transcriptional regulator [Firmicutes bacterium]|jgi:DNA-binding PadR family transcriptional regulator|nr:PadR family transcriptional regulator [Bacillota bacterium]